MNEDISKEINKEANKETTSKVEQEQSEVKMQPEPGILTLIRKNKKPLIVFLIMTLAVFFVASRKIKMISETKLSSNSDREPASVSHFTTEDYWYPNTDHQITFSFSGTPDPAPKYIELNINYNPRIVKIESVDPGTIWTSSTILTNSIDNEKGEATFAIAQGFSAEFTGDDEILTLNVVTQNADDDDEAIFLVMPSSYYSSSDSNKEPFSNSVLEHEARIYIEESN